MSKEISELISSLRSGNSRAIGRVLTLIENGGEDAKRVLDALFPHTGNTYVIGVTGAPGAGKSTLVDRLAVSLALSGSKVGILAVDPSSPFTQGALLGDRIRMVNSAVDNRIFIRSMASRGALGGVAPRTAEAIFAYDAAGFEYVIVETVGVGQGEVEIVKTADTVVVVLVPGMGDGVQALKAGILEIADVFALNKADYDGADKLHREIIAMLSLGEKPAWKPKLIETVATEDKGTPELVKAIAAHREWSKQSGESIKRRESFLRQALERYLADTLSRAAIDFAQKETMMQPLMEELYARKRNPASCADEIIAKYMGKL